MSESVTALLSGLAQSEPCVGTVLWGCHSLAASCTPWGHPGAHSFLLLIIITALPTSLCSVQPSWVIFPIWEHPSSELAVRIVCRIVNCVSFYPLWE